MKHPVKELYNLPEEIKFCKLCVISNQRPRITFDDEGVCSACQYAKFKRTINWEEREEELKQLLDKHRKSNGDYDILVPCSGGKDGSFVAHQLKHKYGMNPLTVTWSPNIYTDIGFQNLRSFIDSGFDNILGTPNGEVNKKLCELSFKHMGDPFQAFIYGQTNFPLRMAVQHNISLLFYGENGEVEYGGDMRNAFKPTRTIADHDEHYFSGKPVSFWEDYGLKSNDLEPYLPPPMEAIKANKTEIHFMGYYTFWDPQENYYYAHDNMGFVCNPDRNEGTYSKYASLDDKIDGFHYWLGYIKFGIGRTTSDAAHEIRDGRISREEGVALVEQFDGEFPEKHFKTFLDYVNITESEFWQMAEAWRSEHIWDLKQNDPKLKKAVWEA